MTTPTEARELATTLQTDIPIKAVKAFRSLADQIDALTAERDSLKKDAEQWRAYKARKDAVIAAGMGRNPMRTAERKPMTDSDIEKLREETFSTNNPFCPVDSKSFRKSVWAAERYHGITEDAAIAKGTACKGFEIEPGVFSGCNQSAGDCPACGK